MVEHLVGDRWAVLVRAHHCMVDGISGITLFESFCDRPVGDDTVEQVEKPTRPGLVEVATRLARLPIDMPRLAVSTVRALVPVLFAAAGPAAGSSFNGPIGRQRRYAVARAELAQVQQIRQAFGVTVNDVAVAAIASAYRGVLLTRGEQPARGTVRVLIPVSVRSVQAKGVLDNRVSA
ncbi:wax ester/triacylglycerol synthase domain-containing protein, partial [Nocardia gipuzkoensis]